MKNKDDIKHITKLFTLHVIRLFESLPVRLTEYDKLRNK